jgi:hypothetical protein
MRFRILQCFTILAVLAVAAPLWARSKSAELHLTDPATIGTTQLQPGAYTLKVDDGGTQVSVVRQGKVIAEVPCHWVQLSAKPKTTEIDLTENQITEIEFSGDLQAAQF